MAAQWGNFALRLCLRLGYIDENLLESIDIEGQKRREEDSKAPAPRGGASQPTAIGRREGLPTMESPEARAARNILKECERTSWRLRLGRVEPPYACKACHWTALRSWDGDGIRCARCEEVVCEWHQYSEKGGGTSQSATCFACARRAGRGMAAPPSRCRAKCR